MKRSYLGHEHQAVNMTFFSFRVDVQSVRFDLYFSDNYDKCILHEML